MTASLLSEIKSNKELQYDVVSPDTVSVSSLGKRSTTEEPIKKKNPAVVKISLWTLAQLNAEDVSKSTAENSLACSNKELHWLCDLIGFNVAMTIEAQFVLSMPERIYKSTLIPLMQQDKRLGETTRKGFYLYDERHKVKPGPKIKKYVEKAREISSASIHPKLAKLSDKDIVEIILFPSVNESCRLLAECTAVKAADLDIAYVMGMGFPPYRNDLALITKVMELTSENIYETVSSAIMKLLDTNCVAAGSKRDLDSQLKIISSNFMVLIMSQHEEKVMKESKRNKSHSDDVGYIESETVDPSMKMENVLPGSERSAEISQVVDYQNYKVGGTFENSNLTAKIMETRSSFMERKDNESVDLGPSTMSSKGIMLEE
ncbi:hypothetical protein FXO38_31171 [Capsicum annuum]|nr:hypothetical protein FXO38_31171 [Capsicum annuum]